MTLNQFNNQYKYKSDKQKFGFIEVWEIPKLQDDGFYYGDCESYCLFLKNNIEQFKDWELYYCKLNGVGHCVLYQDGNIIDCNIRNIVTLEVYSKTYCITEFKKYNNFVVLCKLLVGAMITLFRGKNKWLK